MSSAIRLLDNLSDLRAGERMCRRNLEWSLRVASCPGSYIVTVDVEGIAVACIEDPWLDRAIRRANDAFVAWRDAAEEERLGLELRASIGVAP